MMNSYDSRIILESILSESNTVSHIKKNLTENGGESHIHFGDGHPHNVKIVRNKGAQKSKDDNTAHTTMSNLHSIVSGQRTRPKTLSHYCG